MAVSSKSVFAFACSALLWVAGCDDDPNKEPSPTPEDAGVPDADVIEEDASVEPTECCTDATSCAKPTACAAGELCTLDTTGAKGVCAADCAEEQVCGSLCCPWGSTCDKGVCQLSDLTVEVDPSVWPYPASTTVSEDSCKAVDHCLPQPGRYTLLETGVRVKNAGKSAFKLPSVSTREDMDVSFCQGSYLMRDFITARIKDGKGAVVREIELPTLCTAEGDDYVCAVSGLEPGKQVDLPRGDCNQLDVTGLAKGDYKVELEVNPKHTVAEKRFDNNVASYTFSHTGCDGFLCGGECCPPDVVCVDGKCAKPNLTVHKEVLKDSIYFTGREVAGDMCSMEDRCTLELGNRRLLAFETRIENIGAGAVNMEAGDPLLVEGCDGKMLTKDFVSYRLLDAENKVVLEGHKRDMCLFDMDFAGNEDPWSDPLAEPQPWEDQPCGKLSGGSAMMYGNSVSCQWLDVTGLAAGKYKLEVTVNPDKMISEETVDDNTVRIDVDVPAAACADTEVCGDNIDQDCDNLPDSSDEDCGGPGPGPDPGDYEPTTGNTTCATAHAVTNKLRLSTELAAGTSTESCGAQGSSAFYAVTVAADEIVYVDALDSGAGTSLILHGETCGDTPIACSEKACGQESGLLARTLTPGKYVVEARTHEANVANVARVKFERVPAAGVTLINEPGVLEGDTSDATSADIAGCFTWNDDVGETEVELAGPHDVYAVAHCDSNVSISTCGTSSYASSGSLYEDLSEPTWMCTEELNGCTSDPDGFAISSYMERGIDMLVIGAQTEGAKGQYQLQISF